ncbi:helix-turn-helix transcriptional regulator [uncultured Tateyamaria sp.]|uniref:helix-turn-helix domain-containing protein n=1 Tax=uncultured Tateyamaria sp. TaxID=455651 RepID=UPI00263458B1|nr:helix-turn-helix transcriptional regulator [uncultured Tateyamaria sp.]
MSKNTIYVAFGDNMSSRRKQLNLTQNDLATRTGLSRASIANMERGHQNVAIHHLYAIASALNVAGVSDLLPSLKTVAKTQEEDDMLPTNEALSDTSRASVNDLIRKALKQGDQKRQGR